MFAVKEDIAPKIEKAEPSATQCYHCGTECITDSIAIEDHIFCCEGCKLVYEILNDNGLCDYYKLQSHPGLNQIKPLRSDKYAFLDNEEIAKKLYKFTNGDHTIVTLYLPGVHCSSCMWLIEHLYKVHPGISESRLNFTSKEVTIHFQQSKISFRKIVELLATIGYEPYISLDEAENKSVKKYDKSKIYKLGIAGFCFGNIMLMSFPEYLSLKGGIEAQYANLFRYLNVLLALPVFFYSSSEFFSTAWKGLQQKTLNIDAPIALAIFITFARSLYEIFSGTGGGYLDSMSGIVFFMLVGRVVQERTYKSISFNRDYKSYFPIAVTVMTKDGVESKMLSDLKENDVVLLHNDEIIPADGLVLNGNACIDYSFVTGESEPVNVKLKEMVYAGGRQVGSQITLQILKPVAGSYLTSLWNHYSFNKNKVEENDRGSYIHLLSKYFTYILFGLAIFTGVYWGFKDPTKIVNSVSAMLIVACPCALLLSATFTNGNLLRILSVNGLFLRDTTVIEQLGAANRIVFDKTGTITRGGENNVTYTGHQLSEDEKDLLFTVVRSSKHPYSKALTHWLGNRKLMLTDSWEEVTGAGVQSTIQNHTIKVGSAEFVGIDTKNKEKANVYVSINGNYTCFTFRPIFRDSIPQIIRRLKERFKVSLLSGDNNRQQEVLGELFGSTSELMFEQKPMGKLQYIERLQSSNEKVVMIGDGLNDAGALHQSNVGITLADDINNFTPSCDAILDASKFQKLPELMALARLGKTVIGASFVVSILYNLGGLYFAMRGMLQPMIAAILMPCSTLSIVLITTGLSSAIALKLGLSLKPKK